MKTHGKVLKERVLICCHYNAGYDVKNLERTNFNLCENLKLSNFRKNIIWKTSRKTEFLRIGLWCWTVDGLRRCERWVLDEEKEKVSKEVVKPASLLDRLMGFSEKSNVYWSYPFAENQSFVMTIRAGWEGYHMSVDGRHIASSPYRTVSHIYTLKVHFLMIVSFLGEIGIMCKPK